MKTVAVIQARMGSSRLRGKVLLDLAGRTLLSRVVRRTQRAGGIDQVVVATTTAPDDDVIVEECSQIGIDHFRGSEDDVLDRYYKAAAVFRADVIVRLTSDNPLIDPGVITNVISQFSIFRPDYASNTINGTYPIGLSTEVMTREALTRAWLEAKEPHQREHVTPYFYENSHLFRLLPVRNALDLSYHRWTVDVEEDYRFVSAVYAELGPDDQFGVREVLSLLETKPWLTEINKTIRQKPVRG